MAGASIIHTNNVKPVEHDISIWRGYDFVLPLAVQYQDEIVVGEDINNYSFNAYIPGPLFEPNNKVTAYSALSEAFMLFKFEIFSANKRDPDGDLILLHEFKATAFYCGIQYLMDPPGEYDAQGPLGISGYFSVIRRQFLASTQKTYQLAHLPYNITQDFDFNEAKYCITVGTRDNATGDLINPLKLVTGNILMIGE